MYVSIALKRSQIHLSTKYVQSVCVCYLHNISMQNSKLIIIYTTNIRYLHEMDMYILIILTNILGYSRIVFYSKAIVNVFLSLKCVIFISFVP